MTKEQLAAILNGRQRVKEITAAEAGQAAADGLVVIFGASDDLMEVRGAAYDEIGVYGGGEAHFVATGLLENQCVNDECPYHGALVDAAATVSAIGNSEGYSWVYETKIPHATFEILEDGEKYCRGIVFALADVGAQS